MAIHSVLADAAERARGYPKLRRRHCDKIIVLFHDRTSGMVVSSDHATCPVGFYMRNWTAGEFDDYDGSIVLEND